MKDLVVILVLASLWAVGGFAVGIALGALFGVQWAISCTALNLIAGMIMLLLVTRNEHARRLFYEGPRENESGMPLIGILWAIPFILLFIGVMWWLLAQLLK